jgi:hypothetical protein
MLLLLQDFWLAFKSFVKAKVNREFLLRMSQVHFLFLVEKRLLQYKDSSP